MAGKGILNYTTSIDAGKTRGEVIGLLVSAGATNISLDFENKTCTGVSFYAHTPVGERGFRLPLRADAVLAALNRAYQSSRIPRRFANSEQAERVAWRINHEWLEVQLALIEAGLAELGEIMMPYMIVGEQGQTAFQLMSEKKALPPGMRGAA